MTNTAAPAPTIDTAIDAMYAEHRRACVELSDFLDSLGVEHLAPSADRRKVRDLRNYTSALSLAIDLGVVVRGDHL